MHTDRSRTEVTRREAGAGGGGKGEVTFNVYRVSMWDNKVLKMDSSDSCTTLRMCLMPRDCTLRNG